MFSYLILNRKQKKQIMFNTKNPNFFKKTSENAINVFTKTLEQLRKINDEIHQERNVINNKILELNNTVEELNVISENNNKIINKINTIISE
jgi:hypothetical protein